MKFQLFATDIFLNKFCSPQINLASVDESTGRMTGGFTTYAICGAIRRSNRDIPTIFHE